MEKKDEGADRAEGKEGQREGQMVRGITVDMDLYFIPHLFTISVAVVFLCL